MYAGSCIVQHRDCVLLNGTRCGRIDRESTSVRQRGGGGFESARASIGPIL